MAMIVFEVYEQYWSAGRPAFPELLHGRYGTREEAEQVAAEIRQETDGETHEVRARINEQ